MPDENMPEGEAPEEGADEKETTLVPKSLFGGDCQIGDTYTVKIVGKYEDELEVEHVPDKQEEQSEGDTMAGADKSLDAVAQPEGGY